MGMSNYVMDLEDQFIEQAEKRIRGCDNWGELGDSLLRDGCFNLIPHMDEYQKAEFVEELWNEFWSEYA